MKKISLQLMMILSFISFISCKAQQIMPLNTPFESITANMYLKDLNNELSPYVGIYKSSYQGNEIILHITKEENKFEKSMKKNYYMDALIIKYIVKNSSGQILQDTQYLSNPNIKLYSIGTRPNQNKVVFYYSGTHCNVGWGDIYLSKLNSNQISWEYRPDSMLTDVCPPGTDKTVYLPVTKDLIFTKQ